MNLQDALASGIQALGLDLPADTPERLDAFARLLIKWNKVYNLTAIRDEGQVLTHHLLDSLSVLPAWPASAAGGCGSGGGLPGVVLAIARPDLQVDSVETVQKGQLPEPGPHRAQAANFRAHHARIENWQPAYAPRRRTASSPAPLPTWPTSSPSPPTWPAPTPASSP
jgi:16S rRNA (guanine527-N7)-methyltransferase